MAVPVPVALSGLALLKEFISAGASYLACREHEKTERARIAARLEGYLTTLNAQYSIYSRILDSYDRDAMKIYTMAENLLQDPSVYTNPVLLQGILTFVQNFHAKNSDGMIALTNAVASSNLPKIG